MDNLSYYIFMGIAIIISLAMHEYSHALVATILGDKTAKINGRLTLNPFAHIDPIGLISLFIVRFGWAKPVPVNPYNFENKRFGMIATSIAGPLANLLLAFFSLLILFKFNFTQDTLAIAEFLKIMFSINTGLVVFNFLPIPPLDGSKIFAEIFGGKVAYYIYSMEGYSTFIMLMIIWFAPAKALLITLNENLMYFLISIVRLLA